MPVIDHPIHDSVIKRGGSRYGCHNLPRLNGGESYRFFDVFSGQFIGVPNRHSTECRYDLSEQDESCNGCDHANVSRNFGTKTGKN